MRGVAKKWEMFMSLLRTMGIFQELVPLLFHLSMV